MPFVSDTKTSHFRSGRCETTSQGTRHNCFVSLPLLLTKKRERVATEGFLSEHFDSAGKNPERRLSSLKSKQLTSSFLSAFSLNWPSSLLAFFSSSDLEIGRL